MTSDPVLITLLFAVAASAAIGALNARGPARMAVSSLLALFCLGAALYHSGRREPRKEAALQARDLPPTFPLSGGKAAARQTASPELRGIAEEARRMWNRLSAADPARLNRMSDARYARLRAASHAQALEARRLGERASAAAARPPAGWEETARALEAATAFLASSAGEFARFFNAESGDEEKMRAEAFKNGLESAAAELNKVETRLDGTESAVP